jgi:hypothetical protein
MSPAQVFRARGRLAFAIALVVFLGTAQRPSAAGIQIFTATLTGAQQVPAVSSSGTGTGTVLLNAAEDQITVNLSFSGLTSNANAAHIHGPGAAGTIAGVLFPFTGVPAAMSGSLPQRTFPITTAQVAELKSGLYYFNIHTDSNPGGEIRGQIGFPAITTQPTSQTVAAGQNATFTVAASGAPAPTYQWQLSLNGGTSFTNLSNGAPYSGVTTATLTITAASAGLGGYQYRAIATNSAGFVASNGATLTVTAAPTMSLDKTSLAFSAVSSGAAFTSRTSAQAVRLTQTGAGTVTWTAASTAPWLVVSPASGSGSATLTISTQFASGLITSQTGNINLTFAAASNTAGPINVTLNLISNGTSTGPTGAFDTPIDGTTGVTGSIAVTGWAIDDIEVTGVRILRDPVGGEPAGTLVFIGNAVQVDGARPDVQSLFPTAPRNTRAGWGYLMLTNFLPNLGNGAFKLTAIADDADGHSTTLGTKTITCSNSTATAPTGAIDTPVQGGTVSGTVTNFGWVLSPSPRRADPPSGGTVRVVIDGTFISAVPSGWTNRSDLTALFPASQYPGIVDALGVASFDSTALANGVHTISWVVTDNLGSASGIGSRYFTVSNGSLMLDPAPPAASAFRLPSAELRPGKAEATEEKNSWLPPSGGRIIGRRGFDLATSYRTYEADAGGRTTIQSEELDRIELHLSDTPGPSVAGYLRVAGGLAPLPIGSALNASTGVFTWMPGVGFIGTYDLVFVRWSGGRVVARYDVRIVLNAKGSNRVGPQTIIDLPADLGPAVARPSFVLAGWAADLDSTVDTGVAAAPVWAYPVTALGRYDEPIWIGAAAYGGARPDVAAVYGDRFLNTGYGITVQGLAPGTYDLAVFAYSTVTGGFVPAKTVRVTVR